MATWPNMATWTGGLNGQPAVAITNSELFSERKSNVRMREDRDPVWVRANYITCIHVGLRSPCWVQVAMFGHIAMLDQDAMLGGHRPQNVISPILFLLGAMSVAYLQAQHSMGSSALRTLPRP